MKETYEVAVDINSFQSPLRNIRVSIDGLWASFDLIPSVTSDRPSDDLTQGLNPKLNAILKDTQPIVEAKRFMRVSFNVALAVFVQDEFIETVSMLETNLDSGPRMPQSPYKKAIFPFLQITNSKWKQCVPDYQGGDAEHLKHFKMFSMETCIDVLAYTNEMNVEWKDQT